MKRLRMGKTTEIFLVVLLIAGLCFAMAVIIDAGTRSYKKIVENNRQIESARIVLSYLNMRVRQNDVSGMVQLMEGEINGADALLIKHTGLEKGMVTYIFYQDGWLKEIYTNDRIEPSEKDAENVVRAEGVMFEFKEKDNMLIARAKYRYGGRDREMERAITLRSDRGETL